MGSAEAGGRNGNVLHGDSRIHNGVSRDAGDIRRCLGLVSETRRNAGDRIDGRMAHNPEVGGSASCVASPLCLIEAICRISSFG